MALSNTTKALIGDFDEIAVLWKGLLNAVSDHGGNTRDVEKLIEDIKGPKVLVSELARKLVGSVWKLADRLTNIGPIDFDCPPQEFMARYPTIKFPPGMGLEDERRWTTHPRQDDACLYGLRHFPKPPIFNDIVENPEYRNGHGNDVEYAGWRELVAYLSKLNPGDISGHPILAAGSRSVNYISRTETEPGYIFPVGVEYPPGAPELSWMGVKRPESEKFENRCFYLVRVYTNAKR